MVFQERTIIDALLGRLRDRTPPAWAVREAKRPRMFDAELRIQAPGRRTGCLLVQVKEDVYPSRIKDWAAQAQERCDAGQSLVLAAPFLGPEARRLLSERGIGYFDLTGNVRVVLDEPAIFVEERGADRNPYPAPGLVRTLGGDTALAVVRTLCDFLPPLSVTQIAQLARCTPAYVTKLLVRLERDGLIERTPRQPVRAVDWRSLIEARARDSDLLARNAWRGFVPLTGRPQLLAAMARLARQGQRLAVTAATAAERTAPITAAQTVCYTDDIKRLAESLREFLRADPGVGGAVILLEPANRVVFDRLVQAEGPPAVACSQAAIDCLSGPDRMPEQGLALLDWMERNTARWRRSVPGRAG